MKSLFCILFAFALCGCNNEKSIKELTIDAFEKMHQENIEMLSILCPMKKDAMKCIQMYDIKYRTFNGKNYICSISIK
jgi:hypothetical protein